MRSNPKSKIENGEVYVASRDGWVFAGSLAFFRNLLGIEDILRAKKDDFRICLACHGDGYDMYHDDDGEPVQCECESCQSTGIMTKYEYENHNKPSQPTPQIEAGPINPDDLPF